MVASVAARSHLVGIGLSGAGGEVFSKGGDQLRATVDINLRECRKQEAVGVVGWEFEAQVDVAVVAGLRSGGKVAYIGRSGIAHTDGKVFDSHCGVIFIEIGEVFNTYTVYAVFSNSEFHAAVSPIVFIGFGSHFDIILGIVERIGIKICESFFI